MLPSLQHDLWSNLENGRLLQCCCVELRTRHPGHPAARTSEFLFLFCGRIFPLQDTITSAPLSQYLVI